jgi:hypothetical protein
MLPLLLAGAVYADDKNKKNAAAVEDPKLRAAINKAIARGAKHLKKTQRRDGSWRWGPQRGQDAGITALSLYALAASSVRASDDSIVRGLNWVRTHPGGYASSTHHSTYSASLLVLALARIDASKHRSTIHKLAKRIANGQLAGGKWTYTLNRRGRGGGDNSNAQFAIMALWMAQTHADFPVPKSVWKRVLRLYEGSQQRDGGWNYSGAGSGSSDSMTAAGLFGYVVSSASLADGAAALPKVRQSERAERGLRRLLKSQKYANFYFDYGLERAATLMDAPPERWYVPGAEYLVDAQKKSGGWGGSDAYNTSLALLFLTRATRYVLTPRKNREAAKTITEAKFPDQVTAANLKTAFAAYLATPRPQRDALQPKFAGAGPAAIGLFIERLADPELPVRTAAFELVSALLSRPLLFDPKAEAHVRKMMLQPIRAFWDRRRADMAWDPARQRFVIR